MRHSTFKPLSLALFAMMSTGALSAQTIAAGTLADEGSDDAAKEIRVKFAEESYGTSMGDYNGKSLETKYFYNSKGQLIQSAGYGRDYETGEFGLTRLYYYVYNDNGQIEWTYNRQNGSYDISDENILRPVAADSTHYEYNDAHQLAKKTDRTFVTTYEYDSDGNLVKETSLYKSNGKLYQQLTYSEFNDKHLPAKAESTSDISDDLKYSEDREYDAAGHLVKREAYTAAEDVDPDTGMPVEVKSVKERYLAEYYENGDEKWHVNYIKDYYGNLQPNDSISYTPENDNPDRLVRKTYTFFDNKWSEQATYNVVVYHKYDPTLAVEITVTTGEDEPSNNKIQFKVPEFAAVGGYRFDLYRDGTKVGSADFTDATAFDPETMVYTFHDDSVRNDYHTYFVQTLVGDELGTEYQEIGASNLVFVTNHAELPSVTNLHISAFEQKNSTYNITLAWDGISEEDAQKYGFKRYDVVEENMKTADNWEADGQATTWTVSAYSPNETTKYDVQCFYTSGRSHCYIDVSVKDIISGISQTVADGVETTYDAHVLRLSKAADVKVYNASGALVANEKGTQSVSLESLPNGTYLLLIGNGSAASVRKVMR